MSGLGALCPQCQYNELLQYDNLSKNVIVKKCGGLDRETKEIKETKHGKKNSTGTLDKLQALIRAVKKDLDTAIANDNTRSITRLTQKLKDTEEEYEDTKDIDGRFSTSTTKKIYHQKKRLDDPSRNCGYYEETPIKTTKNTKNKIVNIIADKKLIINTLLKDELDDSDVDIINQCAVLMNISSADFDTLADKVEEECKKEILKSITLKKVYDSILDAIRLHDKNLDITQLHTIALKNNYYARSLLIKYSKYINNTLFNEIKGSPEYYFSFIKKMNLIYDSLETINEWCYCYGTPTKTPDITILEFLKNTSRVFYPVYQNYMNECLKQDIQTGIIAFSIQSSSLSNTQKIALDNLNHIAEQKLRIAPMNTTGLIHNKTREVLKEPETLSSFFSRIQSSECFDHTVINLNSLFTDCSQYTPFEQYKKIDILLEETKEDEHDYEQDDSEKEEDDDLKDMAVKEKTEDDKQRNDLFHEDHPDEDGKSDADSDVSLFENSDDEGFENEDGKDDYGDGDDDYYDGGGNDD